MTTDELKTILLERGIRKDAVNFNDSTPMTEQYCMIKDHGGWDIFYFERGHRNEIQRFLDEDSACLFLLSILEKDRTVWFK